jgi:toxin ParE1/3/4
MPRTQAAPWAAPESVALIARDATRPTRALRTAGHWGAEQAAAYVGRIKTSVEAAATEPKSGAACDHIRAGYRKLRSGSHVLFYRIAGDGIEIMRILHERMDFGRHFPS